MLLIATLAFLFLSAVFAAPSLDGYSIIWADDFDGTRGAAVDLSKWKYQVGVGNTNGEEQVYTTDPANAHLSGDGQVYIIPMRSGDGWTSARLETQKGWNCPAKKAMIFQAEIYIPNFTNNPSKYKSLWPAFWAKGISNRNGVSWPGCGEWDIFETSYLRSNWNQGTLHFKDANGQHNSTFSGRVQYTGGEYHTWALKVDRRDGDWQTDKLIWYLDGKEYYRVTGSQVGNLDVWKQLAWQPYFMIMQVAVGGGYAGGSPDAGTIEGLEASMRVKYAAIYQSN
ncbi:unnamed protein product [Clonostachys rosea]|uniref:GH16 domain-containing protein n=1 Tax=Bionectria ochroleuca TaxID=29856 RepID=A0ABY6UKT6_BIOOC|nr:unnamed protein product [Clonostachys rosea]